MNIKTIFLFLLFISVTICETYSQNLNDFRTISDGNWATPGIWERFDGTIWLTATYYPGNGATNDVSIIDDHTITINSTITANSINSVTIGDRTGGVETLLITGTSELDTSLFTIAYDGLLNWTVNVTFRLPAGADFIVESPNPNGLTLGVDHGIFENTTSCSAAKRLQIGNRIYATCNGGGGRNVETFDAVNSSGGNQSLTIIIIPSTTDTCLDQAITFEAFPSGIDYDPNGTTTYNWSANPTTGGIIDVNSSTTTATPTTTGNITYQVSIVNIGNTASNTTTVTVNNCNKSIITNRRITYRVKK